MLTSACSVPESVNVVSGAGWPSISTCDCCVKPWPKIVTPPCGTPIDTVEGESVEIDSPFPPPPPPPPPPLELPPPPQPDSTSAKSAATRDVRQVRFFAGVDRTKSIL